MDDDFFGEAGGEEPAPAQDEGGYENNFQPYEPPANQDMGYSGGSVPYTSMPDPAEDEGMPEPEAVADNALTRFISEWEVSLRAKAEAEQAKKKAAIDAAREDHDKMRAERASRKEVRMGSNRTKEQVFLEQLEADLESENPWERILSLVNTQAEVTAPFKDTSRIKSMLIQLKSEPLKTAT